MPWKRRSLDTNEFVTLAHPGGFPCNYSCKMHRRCIEINHQTRKEYDFFPQNEREESDFFRFTALKKKSSFTFNPKGGSDFFLKCSERVPLSVHKKIIFLKLTETEYGANMAERKGVYIDLASPMHFKLYCTVFNKKKKSAVAFVSLLLLCKDFFKSQTLKQIIK